jgi:CBS domain containing-hemolysin-like protein
MWMGFIGWFLWRAASASFRQFRQRQGLQGMVARDLMSTAYTEISPEMSVRDLMDAGARRRGQPCFVVIEDGRISGLLGPDVVRRVARRSRESTMVKHLATPLDRVAWVSPEEDSNRVMEVLDDGELGAVPVMDGEDVIGVVIREHLLGLMTSRVGGSRR